MTRARSATKVCGAIAKSRRVARFTAQCRLMTRAPRTWLYIHEVAWLQQRSERQIRAAVGVGNVTELEPRIGNSLRIPAAALADDLRLRAAWWLDEILEQRVVAPRASGLRFRLHRHVVPGASRREIDVVFGSARVAVSVHGCFWHGCPRHTRFGDGPLREWWRRKIDTNIARDEDTRSRLERAGWVVIEVWECEDVDLAAERIASAVAARRQAARSTAG